MELRIAKCMLVAKVLLADGIMTDDERSFLEAAMEKHGLSDAERSEVLALGRAEEAARVVASASIEEKEALVAELVDAASADGKLAAREAALVQRISAALGLDAG